MSNIVYPSLPSGALPDSSQFSEKYEDPTMRTETEGGYVFTRKRHTRAPRISWTISYKELTNADKTAIKALWTAATGSVLIDWTNPQDQILYVVRMKSPPDFQYVGIGATQKWNCTFGLEQA